MRLTGTILASHQWIQTIRGVGGEKLVFRGQKKHTHNWTQNEYKDRRAGEWGHHQGKIHSSDCSWVSSVPPKMKLLLLCLGLTLVCAHHEESHEVVTRDLDVSKVEWGSIEISDFAGGLGDSIQGGLSGGQEILAISGKRGGFWPWTRSNHNMWNGDTSWRPAFSLEVKWKESYMWCQLICSNSMLTSPLCVRPHGPEFKETSVHVVSPLFFSCQSFYWFIADVRGVVHHTLGLRCQRKNRRK